MNLRMVVFVLNLGWLIECDKIQLSMERLPRTSLYERSMSKACQENLGVYAWLQVDMQSDIYGLEIVLTPSRNESHN